MMPGAAGVQPNMRPSEGVLRFRHAFQVALAITLYYWLALSLNLEQLQYGALAIALIGLDTTGASLQKGLMRIVGTTVGLAVGMIALALFAQAQWPTLIFHLVWLLVVGYFMQISKYRYAWFVAGFLPVLIWSTTYGKVETAFSYAVFRYTETTIGIVVFTLVSLLVWPKSAGEQLTQQSIGACKALRQLFDIYHRQLRDGELSGDVGKIETQLASGSSGILLALQNAVMDTSSVRASKAQWKAFHNSLLASSDAIELWRHCIDDCTGLDMERLLSRGRSSFDVLAQRLERIEALWSRSIHSTEQTDHGDDLLLATLPLGLKRDSVAELSLQQRASLLNFVQQWTMLDQSSCELLRAVRGLQGLAPKRPVVSDKSFAYDETPMRWDPMRLVNGMLPAICFFVGFVFWIIVQPPTGPSVPNMAATFGLMVLLTPVRILNLLPSVIIAMVFLIAPTYLLVMPTLSSGAELLTLIFVYSFGIGLFHGRLAGLKALGLPLFVMMTGISNQQSYSFIGLVDGSLMLIMGLGIVAVVQTLLSPSRPEQDAVDSIRRFFRSCANLFSEDATDDGAPHARADHFDKRYFESRVVPGPAKVQAITKRIDYSQLPAGTLQNVQALMDAMANTTSRLRSVDVAHRRLQAYGAAAPDSFHPIIVRARNTLRRLFERLSDGDQGDEFAKQRLEVRQLAVDFHQWFDDLETVGKKTTLREEVIVDLYALMGSFRGLVDAIYKAQDLIGQLDCQEWEIEKF